jgi:type IV secretory pathway VirB9-like protein
MRRRNPLTRRGNAALFLAGCGILACLFLAAGCVAKPPVRPPVESPPPVAAAPPPSVTASPDPALLVERVDPDIEAAMEQFARTGKAPIIDRRKDGFVLYPFTGAEDVIYCQRKHMCRLDLEEGEMIVGKPVCGACWTAEETNSGDMQDVGALWELTGFLSGPEGRRTQHVIVKPREYAGNTNLMFGTDKGRVYSVRLVAKAKQRDVRVGWFYPKDLGKQFAAMRAQVAQEKAAQQPKDITCGFSLPPDQLDQRYTVQGGKAWVANDGKTTCVRPPSMNGELPVVFTETPDGKSAILNYRVRSGYFLIDGVPEVLSFVSGSDDAKRTVTITREGQ